MLFAALGIGQPFARLSRIVEIEHRGDGIDAQPVDMEAVEPVERIGDQEIGHLAAAEIVDRGVPVRLEAAARIGMLVERLAVEAGEAVLIGGEMRRHPVEDHAEPGLMGAIDEAGEARGIAEAAGGREQPDRLVAPGGIERMLADRQQLEMGEAHIEGVGDEPVGEFVIGEEPARPVALPGAEMHLIDGDGPAPGIEPAWTARWASSFQGKWSVRVTTEAV